MRKQDYVSRFALDFPLSMGQRVALLFGAKLTIDIAAVSPRAVERMQLQAVCRVHRNGKGVARAT